MIIRKAKIKDAKSLNNLLTLLIRDEKQYDNNIDENFVVTNMYENYIEDPKRCILVAEDNEKIIGYIYGYLNDADPTLNNRLALLDALYVDENYRKQGIADSLIKNFKEWVISNNVKIIEVGVCSENINAKHLYNKHGFNTVKETLICEINN